MFIEGKAQIPPSIRGPLFTLVIAEFLNSALVTWPSYGGRILFSTRCYKHGPPSGGLIRARMARVWSLDI
jgi:hypothetical protein